MQRTTMFFFILVSATLPLCAYGRFQRAAQPQQQTPTNNTPAVAAPPTFNQLQEQLMKDTTGPSRTAKEVLESFAFTYTNMTRLLGQSIDEWKNAFTSGNAGAALKNISSKIEEGNRWIALVPPLTSPTPGSSLEVLDNYEDMSKSLGNYTKAVTHLSALFSSLGIASQIPPITIPQGPQVTPAPATQSTPQTPITSPATTPASVTQSPVAPPLSGTPKTTLATPVTGSGDVDPDAM